MDCLELKNLEKIYQGKSYQVHALNHISMKIQKGSMTAVMGPSGSGKSTLLHILGIIDTPTSGQYYLNGQEVKDFSDRKLASLRCQTFGFVLQDFALIDQYQVWKNIEIPLHYSNRNKREWKERVNRVLQDMEISEVKNRYPGEISGGQKQRVAIARALVNDGDIILADEPTGALDSRTSRHIMELFQRIKQQGKTIVMVTHDREAASYCDRILEINDGRLNDQNIQ